MLMKSQEAQPMTTNLLPKIDSEDLREARDLVRKAAAKQEETVGQRLARLRRDRGITQEELAGMLGVAQPMISGWERDSFRLNGEVIIALTQILGASADEILGIAEPRAGAPIKNRRLLRKLQQLEQLPRRDQEALLRTIDAFLGKAG